MTRKEWYDNYREERKNRKSTPVLSTLNNMFKEHYSYILNEKDQAKYDLICRYSNKCSYRLLIEKDKLRKKAKENGNKMWTDLIQHESPLFKELKKFTPKDNMWTGPVILKKGEHF